MIYFIDELNEIRFCGEECKEEYLQDLRDGFDYGSVYEPKQDEIMDWSEGTLRFDFCGYCGKSCR